MHPHKAAEDSLMEPARPDHAPFALVSALQTIPQLLFTADRQPAATVFGTLSVKVLDCRSHDLVATLSDGVSRWKS